MHPIRLLLPILIWIFGFNQATSQGKIDSKALQEDLLLLRDIAIGTSPKLTEEGRSRIERRLEQKREQLEGKSMSVIEFIHFLSEIDMETQFDEHASLEAEEEVLMPLLSQENLFPLPLKIIGERVVVNATGLSLPYGSIIHAINGEPMDSVMRSLSRDYNTFSKRRNETQFSIMYLIKKGGYEEFRLKYTTPAAPDAILEKNIAGVGIGALVQYMNEQRVYPLDIEKLDNLINTQYFPDQNAYYLQLNSFSWDQEVEKGLFERFRSDEKNLDKAFKKIFREIKQKGAENLIIDLRYNYGGNLQAPGILYRYIAQSHFSERARLEIPDFSFPHHNHIVELGGSEIQNPEEIKDFTDTYEPEFEKTASGYFLEFIEERKRRPHKQAFQGKVYLLVGGRSVSASAYFSALFRGEKRGPIVGEQVGGSHHSITAGTDLIYRLPNTGIKATVPLMVVSFSDDLYRKVPKKKVNPDVVLPEEKHYQYFLEKKDPELEEVLRLIRERN